MFPDVFTRGNVSFAGCVSLSAPSPISEMIDTSVDGFPVLRVICADPTPCQPSVDLSRVQSTYQLMDKSVEVESAGSPMFSMHNYVYYNDVIVSSLHTCNTLR